MLTTNKRAAKLSAFVLTLALSLLSVAPVWAAPQLSGKLLTNGSSPVLVNGNSATTGATITSGTTIETPDNVSATIQIPGLGEVELSPGSIVTLEFSNGMLKVTLKKGCVVSRGEAGTKNNVVDEKGTTLPTTGSNNTNPAMADGKGSSNLPVCAGAVLASAASTTGAVVGTTAAGGGLSATAITAIVAAVAAPLAIIGIVQAGDDPSPSNP